MPELQAGRTGTDRYPTNLAQLPTTPGLNVDPAQRHKRLRSLATEGPPLVLPGVTGALWARLCESLGFEAVYLTGAGISNMQLALADVGFLSFTEMLDQVNRVVEAVTVPVVVDADTGYGGPNTVARAALLIEKAGASAMQIEDQTMPKRCGHFDGKSVVSPAAMQARIDAAVQVRRDPNFMVIARTDAYGVDGLDAALQRAEMYQEAGADVIFIEAPSDPEDLAAIPRAITDVPLVFNVVEGGLTPSLPRSEIEAMGYRIILHANYLMRAAILAATTALETLRDRGDELDASPILSWEARQELVRLPELEAFEDDLRKRWGPEV